MKGRFWLAIAASLVTSYLVATTASVRLIDTIAVSPSGITLGEIAMLETADAGLKDRLAAVKVAPAPSVNNARVVTAHTVREALDNAGFSKDVEVLGAQSVVSLTTRLATDEELTASLKDYVNNAIDGDTEVEMKILQLPVAWKIPAGKEVIIAVEGQKAKVSGSQIYTLRAVVGDKTFATAQARAHVTLRQERLVLTRSLERKDILTADMCEMRSVEVSGTEVASSHEVIGLAARRNMKPGTVISLKDFEKPVCIERGSPARIIIVNNEVRMQVTGAQALQSGKVGELILFANPMNAKEPIKAKVLRAGVAVMDLGSTSCKEDYR